MNQELIIILDTLIESYKPRTYLCKENLKEEDLFEKCYQTDCDYCPLGGLTYYNYSLIKLKQGYHV